jgi:hypothetical protein
MAQTANDDPIIGEYVEGIDFPVLNERAVRASAGIMFLAGIIAYMIAVLTGDYQPLRMFGILFLFDMAMRLFVGTRFTPSLIIGELVVRQQRPEWVGASQKRLAWSFGLVMAGVACVVMGFMNIQGGITLALCGLCLGFLFIESAFGVCVGCELQRRFATEKPQLCAGDVCSYVPPKGVFSRRHTALKAAPLPGDEDSSG